MGVAVAVGEGIGVAVTTITIAVAFGAAVAARASVGIAVGAVVETDCAAVVGTTIIPSVGVMLGASATGVFPLLALSAIANTRSNNTTAPPTPAKIGSIAEGCWRGGFVTYRVGASGARRDGGFDAAAVAPIAALSAFANSPAREYRCDGSFASAPSAACSTASGTRGLSVRIEGGCSFTCPYKTRAVSP